MGDLSPCALALIAVSEDNHRLKAALDFAAAAAYEYGKRTGDLITELRAAERQVLALTEQLAEAQDELATVQNDRAAADRNAATYRRDLHGLQDRIVELEGRLAVAHDDARADREALQRYRARDATRGDADV